MNLINNIFETNPGQWGLRGDPHMWKELKHSLTGLNKGLSQIEFEEALENRFHDIIKQHGKQTSKDIVAFKIFPQMGMSGGLISLKWWEETGLPFIKKKYAELNK